MGRINTVIRPVKKLQVLSSEGYPTVYRYFAGRPDLPTIVEPGTKGETVLEKAQKDITNNYYSTFQLPDEKSIHLRHIMARHR